MYRKVRKKVPPPTIWYKDKSKYKRNKYKEIEKELEDMINEYFDNKDMDGNNQDSGNNA